ncbi:hypothetical protein EVAR_31231_1 [Eumeta japonica]|uniref:Uncharacterized protein n=1 Tax=Eumeta variegata TaxID=151549 RepID=A0A4C1VZ71_EUMVA|nr:hypothetical protein EVAR_31231_1 [Eumeta japonica]
MIMCVFMETLSLQKCFDERFLPSKKHNARNSAAVKLVTKASQWRKLGARGRRRKGRGALNLRQVSHVLLNGTSLGQLNGKSFSIEAFGRRSLYGKPYKQTLGNDSINRIKRIVHYARGPPASPSGTRAKKRLEEAYSRLTAHAGKLHPKTWTSPFA